MTASADAEAICAMRFAVLVVALLSIGVARAGLLLSNDEKYTLPPNFLFGAGTSAVQTEGAWDKDGVYDSDSTEGVCTRVLVGALYPLLRYLLHRRTVKNI